MAYCPNLSNKQVKKEFEELVDIFGETKAYELWNSNKGNPLDKTSDGKESTLFKDVLEFTENRREALELISVIHNPKFKEFVNKNNVEHTLKEIIDYRTSKEANDGDYYAQLSSKEHEVSSELDRRIRQFLKKIGVKVEAVDKITTTSGNVAIAKADIINRVIQVAKGLARKDTLPHEASHFFVELLGDNNPMLQKMMKDIVNMEVYNEVYDEYKNVYTKIENGKEVSDIDKIKKEAIGQAITEEILKISNETEANKNIIRKFIDRVLNWFKSKLGNNSFEDINMFSKAAEDILNAEPPDNYEEVFKTLHSGLHNVEYYQQEDITEEVNKIREKLNKPPVFKKGRDYFVRETMEKVSKRVTDYVKAFNKRYNRYAKAEENKAENILKAKKGTVVHKYEEIIIRKVYEWDKDQDKTDAEILTYIRSLKYDTIREEVAKDLIKSDDFIEHFADDGIFKLGYLDNSGVETGALNNFRALQNKGASVYSMIKDTQNEINKKGNTPNAKFSIHLENMIYDKPNDTAGTLDLIAVFSNGYAAVLDWKSINFLTAGGKVVSEVGEIRRREYNIQLGHYTEALMREYGIKGFTHIRVIPIRVKLSFKNPEYGFYEIETKTSNDVGKDYLDDIPMDNEVTDSKKINNALKALFKERDRIVKLLDKDYKNLSLKGKLAKLNLIIKNLQLKSDANVILDDLKLFLEGASKKFAHGKDSKDRVNWSDISDYIDYINFYKKALTAITEGIDVNDKSDNSLVYSLGRVVKKLEDMDAEISAKIVSMTQEQFGLDLTQPHNEETVKGKYMRHLSEFNPIAFQVLNKLHGLNTNSVRVRLNKTYEKIETNRENVRKWGKSVGWSLNKIHEYLITDKTGKKQLISKWNTKFWNDKYEAANNKDLNWFLENTEIVKSNNKYYYSDKKIDRLGMSPKEWFEQELKLLDETLDKKYGDNKFQKILKENERNKWLSKYDITNNPETAFNDRNRFLQAKEKPEFYSEKWMFMSQNKPLLDYYNMFVDMNKEFMSITDGRVDSERFMPQFLKDLIDSFGENGIKGFAGTMPSIKNIFRVREFDSIFGSIDPETGKPLRSIPLYGTDTISKDASDKELDEIYKKADEKFGNNKGVEYENYVQSETIKLEERKGGLITSNDLAKSFTLFAEAAYAYDAYSASEDLVKSLEYFVNIANNPDVSRRIVGPDGNLVLNQSEEIESALGYNKTEREAFTKFINLYWYGQNMQDTDIQVKVEKILTSLGAEKDTAEKISKKAESTTYSLTKLIQWLNGYVGIKLLGLNYISGASNTVGMVANLSYAGMENKYFNKALRKTSKLITEDFNKFKAIVKYFEVYTQTQSIEKANKVSSSWIARNITSEKMFMFMKNPGEAIDNAILIAMMHRYGLKKNEDGTTELVLNKKDDEDNALINLFKYNEKTDIWEIDGLSDWDFADFRQKVQWQATLAKGDIPDKNKLLAQTTLAGQILGKFRWWMIGYGKKRLKNLQYDPQMGDFDVGRFKVAIAEFYGDTLLDVVKNTSLQLVEMVLTNGYSKIRSAHHEKVARHFYNKFINQNPQYRDKLSFEEYVEMRKNKLKATSWEIKAYLAIIGLVKLMAWFFFGAGDDDRKEMLENKEDNYFIRTFQRVTYIITKKAQFELGFSLSPYSTLRSFRISPAAIFSVTKDAENIIDNTIDEIQRSLDMKDGRNDTPFMHYGKRMFPGGTTFERTFDPNDVFKYQQIR